MVVGPPNTAVRKPEKKSTGFLGRACAKREYLGYTSIASKASVSTEKIKSTRCYPLKDGTDEVPATSKSGAL